MNFTSRPDYRFGRAAESLIAKWLMRKGWPVLPVYEKILDEGKGPQLFTGAGAFVAPDMVVFKDGCPYWIEAKHKRAFSWHRQTGRWVTGIDRRHFGDYSRVAEATQAPIWLLFLHEGGQAKDSPPDSPAGLFGEEIEVLGKKENQNHESDRWGHGGMIYWAPQSCGGALRLIAPLEELVEPTPHPVNPAEW